MAAGDSGGKWAHHSQTVPDWCGLERVNTDGVVDSCQIQDALEVEPSQISL